MANERISGVSTVCGYIIESQTKTIRGRRHMVEGGFVEIQGGRVRLLDGASATITAGGCSVEDDSILETGDGAFVSVEDAGGAGVLDNCLVYACMDATIDEVCSCFVVATGRVRIVVVANSWLVAGPDVVAECVDDSSVVRLDSDDAVLEVFPEAVRGPQCAPIPGLELYGGGDVDAAVAEHFARARSRWPELAQ